MNWYDFHARYYTGIIPMFTAMDPHAENYYNTSPYVYTGNSPVNRIDPDGKDWYWIDYDDEEQRSLQYDPNVKSQRDLQVRQRYAGATLTHGSGTYREDGSIMFSNETDGYKRIWNNSQLTGNEEFGVITDNGVLVLPSWKNTPSSADIAGYGYGFKDGNVIDASGTSYSTTATVHTHPSGGLPTTWDLTGTGDLLIAGFGTPHKPVYVFRMTKDDINPISFIISGPNLTGKYSGFDNYDTYTISKNALNVQSLLDGVSLRRYTIDNRVGNLRKSR